MAIKTEDIRFDVMVLYAPQRTSEEKDQWWKEVTRRINQRVTRGIPIIVMGDMNARLGSVKGAGIGHRGAEPECASGTLLRECIETNDLTALNTTEKHWGPTNTYASSRLDYLLISTPWVCAITQTWRDEDMDLLHNKKDHRPVVGNLQMMLTTTGDNSIWTFDRKEAFKKENHDKIQRLFETFPEPAWEIAIDEHVQRLEEHLIKGLHKEFPKNKVQQKTHPYVGENMWNYITNRKMLDKETKMIRRQKERVNLRKAFSAWKGEKQHDDDTRLINQYDAFIQEAKEQSCKTLKWVTKQDKTNYLQMTIQQMQEACYQKDTKAIFKKLKIFRPKDARKRIKVPAPLPKLSETEWTIDDKESWALAWHQHWAALECAEIRRWHDHEEELQQMMHAPTTTQETDAACQLTPSLEEVGRTIKSLKKEKAPGPDGIPAETFILGGPAATKVVHTIAMKQLFRQAVPRTHKGGWAHPIYKHKGAQSQRSSYRAIVLQNNLSKLLARLWRPHLTRKFDEYASPKQGGVRKGLGPVAHILKVRTHQALAHLEKQASATIFMDVESAFYRTMRGLFIHSGADQDKEKIIKKVFQTFDLSPLQYDETKEHLDNQPALEEAGVSRCIQKIIEDGFKGNWTRVRGSHTCITPATGTRPGDPSADVLFSFVVTRILKAIKAKLLEQGFSEEEANGLAWIDDLVFCVRTTAEKLEEKTKQILQTVHDECMQHAMRPSLQPGKPDILWNFAGPGTQHYKRQQEENGKQIKFQTRDYGVKEVDITQDARYLGAVIDARRRLLPEIINMTAAAYSNVRALRKPVLANPGIQMEQRRWIMQALAISKATFSCGSWPKLTHQEQKSWETRIMRIYRLLETPAKEGKERSNLYFLATYALPDPNDLISFQRIRLLASIARWADDEYLATIRTLATYEDEQTWTSQVLLDYNRIGGRAATFEEMLMGHRTDDGQKRVQNLIKAYMKKEKHINKQKLQIRIAQKVQQDGGEKDDPHRLEDTYKCEQCEKSFATKTALGVHCRVLHDKFSEASYYTPGSTCPACGREFHTRKRAIQHVQYGTMNCLQWLRERCEPLSSEQVRHLNQKERQQFKEAEQSGRRTLPQIRTYMKASNASPEHWTGEWSDYFNEDHWPDEEQQELYWLENTIAEELLEHFENFPEAGAVDCFCRGVTDHGAMLTSARVAETWLSRISDDVSSLGLCTEDHDAIHVKLASARRTVLGKWKPL